MRRAQDPYATAKTLKLLHDVTNSCDVCQRLAKQPGRFRVALPNQDIVFNRTVYLDLMSIHGRPVLHMVCKDTKFSAAVFLEGESSRAVWVAYLRNWVTPYIGYSTELHADRGPCFNSSEWRTYLQATGIKRKDSGIESHNALGAGESYHHFLRRVYQRVQAQYKSIDAEDCLCLAVHALNCTAGPNGLSPILLVFGVTPSIQLGVKDLPEHRKRMSAMKLARDEMTRLTAKLRLSEAVKRRVPVAADSDILIGSSVLFYREDSKTWEGPYMAVAGDAKQIWILVNGEMKLVSIDKVKPYSIPNGNQKTVSIKNDYGSIIDQAIRGEILLTFVSNKLAPMKGDLLLPTRGANDTYLSEKLSPNDPRIQSKEFIEAKKEEIEGLRKRNTWTTVKTDDVTMNANIIGGRFICEIKDANTQFPKPKARFVAQGYNDDMKDYIVHDAPCLRQETVRLVVSFSAIMSYRLGSIDFRQAYLQSEYTFSRKIFIRPKPEDRDTLGISKGELLQLRKPLYGICDSGDYWNTTFFKFVKEELLMTPLSSDIAAFYKKGKGATSGMLGLYVDDSIAAVGPEFVKEVEKIQNRFDAKPTKWDQFHFLGVRISTKNEPMEAGIEIDQPQHISDIEPIPTGTTFREFRSIRAKLSWLSHTRPDRCCAINRAAQVTEANFSRNSLRELNNAIVHVLNTKEVKLTYPKLHEDSLHLRAYADASFATNYDMSSQLGYLILLCDMNDRCHVLAYKSRKSRRVVRSIMAGETYAFADALDFTLSVRHDLTTIYNRRIPISMFTDSKQLFDVITKATYPTERRLMIDVAAARECYTRFEISNIALVRGDDNPADALTKPNHGFPLLEIIRTAKDKTKVVQWIHRTRN